MIKIGITGSLASGKTTASRILSFGAGPLFSADKVVKKIYLDRSFKNLIAKRFNLLKNKKIKNQIRSKILENKKTIKKLEKIIHPLVRLEMKNFLKKHKNKRVIFFEIPLLIESKLMNKFDVIIFIKANKSIRFKRFKSKGGNKKLFKILDKQQLNDKIKMKYCDHVVVNEKKINILKKKLSDIIKNYV